MNGADSDTPIEPATAASISEYVGATDIVAPLPSTSSGQKDEGPPSPSAVRASDVDWGLPPLRVDGGAGASDEEDDRDGDHKPPHRSRSAMIERFSSLDPSNLQTLLSGGLERFYGKYKNAWKQNNLSFPTPEVHFDNLSYTVWLSKESPQAKSSIGGYFRGFVAPWRKLRTVKKVILHPMTGTIQPGTLTLILANPGAGKSSFLKALIGKVSSRKGLRSVKGTVSFSGMLAEEINVSKLVGLIDQIDNHFPTLTVRETIQFADRCLNGPPESQPPKLREVARLRTELCLHILGLSKCADTVVGDALLRGVSGGERKRVTLGEMLVGGQSVFLCDEISTGLDSAAIFDIVKSLRSWTRALGGSAVVALLQPPPQVVDLFDDVLVLAEGRLVYHGARVDMLPYFASLGFTCPQRVDPAEFVCDVVSGLGAQFLDHPDVTDDARAPLAVAKPPRRASQFEECFQNSQIYRRTLALMAEKRRSYLEMQNEAELQSVAHLIDKHSTSSAYRNSFFGATRLLLARQQKIWFRDHALVASKLIEAVCVGVLLGVIYLNVTTKLYLRMLFFTIAIFQRQAWQQLTVSFQMRPVFYKQRSRNFFRTLSYTIAESLVQIPLNLAVSVTIVVIFYFMSGLSRDGSTFIKFYIIIVSFQHAISAYFTLLASFAPSVTIAQALASLSVSFFLLFSGNIILPNLIPDYWIWMYWFNPVAWTLRAVLLNEFHDSRHSEAERKKFLDQFQVTQGPKFIWIAIIVLLLYYVLFTLLNTLVLRYIHYESTSTAAQAPLSAEDHYSPEETKRAHAAAQHTIKKVVRRGSASLRTGASIESRASSSESADKGSVDHVVLHVPPHEFKAPDSNGGTAPGSPSPAACIPAYLAVRDLNYFVPNPANLKEELQLLNGVNASFTPGTMTALMGASGAGKTTFMDVLAGRKTGGRIVGDIRVNGEAKDPATFSRIAGYCEQMDIHSGGASIMEALEFSATLRLPASTSEAEHRAVVDGAMDLLELRPLAKELVRNCSVEQKKRITIGVEMVANPSLLFLDEPTSGLDARSASIVMKGVLSIARTGRTVICTIHQPSKQIFELFDSLLLLQKGGYTAYFGELGHDSHFMLEYFASIPGTPAITPQSNPATYMLEVIGAGIGRGQARDYSVEYAKSELCASNKATADSIADGNIENLGEDPDHTHAVVPFSTLNLTPIATGFSTQFKLCVWKMALTYWRNPQYNLMRMVAFPVYAVIFGSTFYKLKESTTAAVSSHVGLMYNTLDFIGVINLMTVLDTVTTERAVFYRERMSNYYGALPYSLSLFLAELPYLIIVSFIFINVEYWMVGWEASAWGFFLFWFVFFLHVSICTSIGQFMSVLMPNIKVANVAVGAVSVFFNLFSGFLMPHQQMRTFYSWIRYLVVTNYSLESIVSIELGHCDDDHPEWHGCTNMIGPGGNVTGKLWKYIETNFDFRVATLGRNIGVLLGFWAALQIAIYLTLRFVSHLKR